MIVRLNPAICSTNLGDQIIVDSINKQMAYLFNENTCIDVSTHQPLSLYYILSKKISDIFKQKEFSFVLGSNLLESGKSLLKKQWSINRFSAKLLGPAILIGAGWKSYKEKKSLFTKRYYDLILSHDYIHSVRDSYTEKILKSIGFNNVVNTGCPTMWTFTKDFCKTIPTRKAKNVITTVTDYYKDPINDGKMIALLLSEYDKVYFWTQGSSDYNYLKELDVDLSKIIAIKPNLETYDFFLENNDVDYVGTRLHGGIRALQHGRRSLIVAIDNRADELHSDFNIPVISRKDIDLLPSILNLPFGTNINIPVNNIKAWKEQFIK